MKDEFKQCMNKRVGVRGWHCDCCGPKNQQEKQRIRRFARRTLKKRLHEYLKLQKEKKIFE
jgi:hypothetical protein